MGSWGREWVLPPRFARGPSCLAHSPSCLAHSPPCLGPILPGISPFRVPASGYAVLFGALSQDEPTTAAVAQGRPVEAIQNVPRARLGCPLVVGLPSGRQGRLAPVGGSPRRVKG